MNKHTAITLLGGSVAAAAEAIGITSAAVSQWPDTLTPKLVDRVQAALARKHLPAEVLGAEASVPEANQAPALASKAQAAMKTEAVEQSHE